MDGDDGECRVTIIRKMSPRARDTLVAWALGAVTALFAASCTGVFHAYLEHEEVMTTARSNSAQLTKLNASVGVLTEDVAVLTATVNSRFEANQRERDELRSEFHSLQARGTR